MKMENNKQRYKKKIQFYFMAVWKVQKHWFEGFRMKFLYGGEVNGRGKGAAL